MTRPTAQRPVVLRPTDRRAFLLGSGGVIAAGLLVGCETAEAPSAGAPPAASPPATPPRPVDLPTGSGGAVAARPRFPTIIDTAIKLTPAQAQGLKSKGVETVFRYYSHVPPSIRDKYLTPEERDVLFDAGLSIGTVWQHYNNCYRTFENRWGREDAEQALRQAEGVGQPSGSTIYFGVDGDWPYGSMLSEVTRYFEDVNQAFQGSGYDVGVYSNGCTCDAIRKAGLAERFWLSGSTAHTGTQAFYNSNRWTMFQNALDIEVGEGAAKIGVDTNLLNPSANGYFGQWDARGAQTARQAGDAPRAVYDERRFVIGDQRLLATPEPSGVVLGTVRGDRNVAIVSAGETYSKVVTQEGGTSRATGAALTGWLPTAALKTLDSFPGGSTSYGLCGSSSQPSEAYKYDACAKATSRLR